MRTALIVVFLLLPVLAAAYHFGPGQMQLRLDDTAGTLRAARHAALAEDWSTAAKLYAQALTQLPPQRTRDAQYVRLELAKAQMQSAQLPESLSALLLLMSELQDDTSAPRSLVDDTRSALANAQYHMTWLMRLEGLPKGDWEAEIESSRQNYRLLAEQAGRSGDPRAAARHLHDLEAAIRLARMDLKELQGLPIPSQCKNCCSGQCKKIGKKGGKSPQQKKEKSASAGEGPLPDGSGS